MFDCCEHILKSCESFKLFKCIACLLLVVLLISSDEELCKAEGNSYMPLSVARLFSTAFLLIMAGVILNGSALAAFGRPMTSSGRMEQILLAQKTQEQKSTKIERIAVAIPVRALPNVPLLV